MKRLLAIALLVLAPAPALAQDQAAATAPAPAQPGQPQQSEGLSVDVTDENATDLVIIIPAMPTPQVASTPAGATDALGRQVADVVAADLRNSGLFAGSQPGARARLWRSHHARFRLLAQQLGAGAGPGFRPRRRQRHAHGRLLSLRRRARHRADAPGLRGEPGRLAPRRAQMRRHHLHAPHRRGAPISTAASSTSPRRAPRITRSSASRSWIRMAPTIVSSPTARRSC